MRDSWKETYGSPFWRDAPLEDELDRSNSGSSGRTKQLVGKSVDHIKGIAMQRWPRGSVFVKNRNIPKKNIKLDLPWRRFQCSLQCTGYVRLSWSPWIFSLILFLSLRVQKKKNIMRKEGGERNNEEEASNYMFMRLGLVQAGERQKQNL